MLSFFKNQGSKIPADSRGQWVFLLLIGMAEFLLITAGSLFHEDLHYLMLLYIGIALLGFWYCSLRKGFRSIVRCNVLLGIAMVLWLLIVEIMRRMGGTAVQPIPQFLAVYLIALPFATLAQDQDRQAGIRTIAKLYIAGALILLLAGLLLLVAGHLSAPVDAYIRWENFRLQVIHHPNIVARIFMVCIALCLGFLSQSKKTGTRIFLLAVASLMFAGIALTNSRTCILLSCLLIAGNVFFFICKGKLRRIPISAIVAILVAAALFASSNMLFQWNSHRLAQAPAEQLVEQLPEAVTLSSQPQLFASPVKEAVTGQDPSSRQDSWLDDLSTLNNRTIIWGEALKKIQSDPMILLRGVTDKRYVDDTAAIHTHNAWLESLLILGLPGFLMCLFFTLQALWSSLRLLFSRRTDLWKKNIAMLILVMLVASIMEPSLFATSADWHALDFLFFLCLGYLTLWRKQLSAK